MSSRDHSCAANERISLGFQLPSVADTNLEIIISVGANERTNRIFSSIAAAAASPKEQKTTGSFNGDPRRLSHIFTSAGSTSKTSDLELIENQFNLLKPCCKPLFSKLLVTELCQTSTRYGH